MERIGYTYHRPFHNQDFTVGKKKQGWETVGWLSSYVLVTSRKMPWTSLVNTNPLMMEE